MSKMVPSKNPQSQGRYCWVPLTKNWEAVPKSLRIGSHLQRKQTGERHSYSMDLMYDTKPLSQHLKARKEQKHESSNCFRNLSPYCLKSGFHFQKWSKQLNVPWQNLWKQVKSSGNRGEKIHICMIILIVTMVSLPPKTQGPHQENLLQCNQDRKSVV